MLNQIIFLATHYFQQFFYSLNYMFMGVGELTIILVFGIPIVAILGGVLITIVKILKSDGRGSGQLSAEEAKTLQEIRRGLDRMERRVEALETILTERSGRR